MKQWFFRANSVRYASAMGGPDLAAFKNGWWSLTEKPVQVRDLFGPKTREERPGPPKPSGRSIS